jgi:hypothetical protein
MTRPDRHILQVGNGDWVIQHPLSCLQALFDCPVKRAAERDLTDPPAEPGRFLCGLDSEGLLTIRGLATEATR